MACRCSALIRATRRSTADSRPAKPARMRRERSISCRRSARNRSNSPTASSSSSWGIVPPSNGRAAHLPLAFRALEARSGVSRRPQEEGDGLTEAGDRGSQLRASIRPVEENAREVARRGPNASLVSTDCSQSPVANLLLKVGRCLLLGRAAGFGSGHRLRALQAMAFRLSMDSLSGHRNDDGTREDSFRLTSLVPAPAPHLEAVMPRVCLVGGEHGHGARLHHLAVGYV